MCRPYYEELEPGQVFESEPRRITETDVIMFTSLTNIRGPLFFSDDFAAKTPFAGPVVPGPLTLSYAIGLTGDLTSGRVLAAVSIDNVHFLSPVRIGDIIRVTTSIIGKQDSHARPGTGRVLMSHGVFNQRGEKVVHYERTLIIGTRYFFTHTDGTP